MTSLWLAVVALLVGLGALTAGSVPRVRLRVEERVLIGLVVSLLVGSGVTYLLALAAGLSVATVLGGQAITAAGFAAVAWPGRRAALDSWREGWAELMSPQRRGHLIGLASVFAAAVAIFVAIFAHTMTIDSAGNLNAGFEGVWADWSQHLTTMSSFAVAHNLPPHNPLLSGQDLRYPFLPDFESATLVVLGASAPVALAVPGAVLALVITLLVVTLAVRLGAGVGAGVIAAAVCMIGGGLGFSGILADACLHHGFTATQCTWSGLAAHPADIPGIVGGTMHDLPGLVAAQPRAYDGYLTPAEQQPIPNQQWYTPLYSWWLPQRSILYGFAGALAVLTLVIAAARSPRRGYESFALAGLLLGLMPLIHIHTLVAMAVALPFLALWWRHRGWWITVVMTAVVATPRLVTLLTGDHGSAAFDNAFPTTEPGWLSMVAPGQRPALSWGSLAGASGDFLHDLVTPQYWGFWVVNLGVAVPLCALLVVAVAGRRLGGSLASASRRVTALFPADLLRVALPFVAIFVLANVVVLQSWDWDNTKLFTYWYLGFALLLGALVTRWWRRWWRGVAAFALAGSVLLTGVLVLLRLLPWTPAGDAQGGPYQSASADEARMAAVIAASTPQNAVFLTEGRPNDPLLTLAGRTTVLGYYGWLWSYGTDFGTRVTDVHTMLEGCHSVPRPSCPAVSLLRGYGVAYVEIDDRLDSPGVIDSQVDLTWWAQQDFPVVARSDHITVYDVRDA